MKNWSRDLVIALALARQGLCCLSPLGSPSQPSVHVFKELAFNDQTARGTGAAIAAAIFVIQLLRVGLRGMPDLELIVVVSEDPSENDGIEIPLVDMVLEEDRPLVEFDFDFDADLLESILREGGDVAADFIAVVRDEGERKSLSVFDADPIGTRHPSRLIQQRAGLVGIVSRGASPKVAKWETQGGEAAHTPQQSGAATTSASVTARLTL